jgi:hypothetical protein
VWPFWLDDWVIGGFLLYGAWRTAPGRVGGQTTLAAAWGFACGLAYASFFSQVTQLDQPDPSGFPSPLVAVIKAIMFALAITALVIVMRWKPPRVD